MLEPTTEHLVRVSQDNLSRELTLEELQEIELFRRGQQLSSVVNTEAWVILTDTLKSYSDAAVEELLRLAPGDPTVLTAHAAASALVQQNKLFIEDIDRAVEAAQAPPQFFNNNAAFNF